eukprot:3404121-Rhodomonas_salina.1
MLSQYRAWRRRIVQQPTPRGSAAVRLLAGLKGVSRSCRALGQYRTSRSRVPTPSVGRWRREIAELSHLHGGLEGGRDWRRGLAALPPSLPSSLPPFPRSSLSSLSLSRSSLSGMLL